MKIFFDTSVVIAAFFSPEGGSAKALTLCEMGILQGYLSRDVVEEIESVFQRKFPENILLVKIFLQKKKLKIIAVKKLRVVEAARWIRDPDDAKILAGAKQIKADYLLTLDIRDFIKDRRVSKKSGLMITTPGDFLENAVFGI